MSKMLRIQWQKAWRELGVSLPCNAVVDRLVACYSEPHRKYHTLQHLTECFTHLDAVRSVAQYPAEIAVAPWFHDAVYKPKESDNEERSADWARSCAQSAEVSSDSTERIHGLVMATNHTATPTVRDAEVIVDIDLAILGESESRFNEYERQVRDEYSWLPDDLFCSGRRKILQQFVDREVIYRTGFFRASREIRARENIAKSLARLHDQ